MPHPLIGTGRAVLGRAAAPWTPADSAYTIAWWQADTLELSHNDAMGTWPDSEGSLDMTQAAAVQKPTFEVNIQNGLPGVNYDGNDILSNATADWRIGDTSGVCVSVVRNTDESGAQAWLSTSKSDGIEWLYPHSLAAHPHELSLNVRRQDGGVNNGLVGSTDLTGATRLVISGSTGAAYFARVDGAVEALGVDAGADDGKWMSTLPDRTHVSLGGVLFSTTIGDRLTGYLFEQLYLYPFPPLSELLLFESYLNAKWAIY